MVGDQEMSSESLKPFGRVEAKLCCLQIETKITFRKLQASFGLPLRGTPENTTSKSRSMYLA